MENGKGKLVLKLNMLDFKEIIITEIFCSICIYLVCYKLLMFLAYPYFSYCCMNCDDCTVYVYEQVQMQVLEHLKEDMP